MRRFIVASLAFTLFAVLSLIDISGALAQTRDVAGSRDYPGIGRFAGSVITGYLVKDFDAARLQAAAFKDGKPTAERRLEGRVTRIAYRTGPLDPRSLAQFRDPARQGRIRDAAGL
jgi:OmpA-OmpF porin, OOP family